MKIKILILLTFLFLINFSNVAPTSAAEDDLDKKGITTGTNVNLRAQPALSAKIITVLERGTLINIIESKESWSRVKLNEKCEGWIYNAFISADPNLVNSRGHFLSQIWSIIQYAKCFLGTRYIYGGTSPHGFDCSGFSMFIYAKFGYKLPHQASTQMHIGKSISTKEELIPGDLVFFKTRKSYRVNHVGIYLGEGRFIHSSLSGVTISRLNSNYYKTLFCGARRLIPSPV